MGEKGEGDGMIGLADAARVLSRAGRPPVHPATLTKWIRFGVPTPAGAVRLRAVKIGSRWATSRAWLDEFVAATTAAAVGGGGGGVTTPAERARAADAAVAELRKLGI